MGDSQSDKNLNQQPLDQPLDSASRLEADQVSESETNNDVIQNRFRHLNAVTLRAGLTMGRGQTRNITTTGVSPIDSNGSESIRGRTEERGKGCVLVAMALGMDSEGKRRKNEEGASFYDCNVCFDMAREPILTCCGHMFCWACFCKLPYIDSTARECPVCEGEVLDSSIIPIYGNADSDSTTESRLDSALVIPPRPKAQRVDTGSVRPRRVAQNVTSNDRTPNPPRLTTDHPLVSQLSQLRRVLANTSPFASVAFALNNAERLVEGVEAYIIDPYPDPDPEL